MIVALITKDCRPIKKAITCNHILYVTFRNVANCRDAIVEVSPCGSSSCYWFRQGLDGVFDFYSLVDYILVLDVLSATGNSTSSVKVKS